MLKTRCGVITFLPHRASLSSRRDQRAPAATIDGHRAQRWHLAPRAAAADSSGDVPAAPASPLPTPQQEQQQPPQPGGLAGWWRAQQQRRKEAKAKLGKMGAAAVLAYGMIDGVSKTAMFAAAFLAYEAHTGLNPAHNVADLVRVYVLMWAGSNLTRPFRLAGAAALAPAMDKVMDGLQERLQLTSRSMAFALVVAVVAGACLSVLAALFLSRWVRP